MRYILLVFILFSSLNVIAKDDCLSFKNISEFNETSSVSMIAVIRAIQVQQLQMFERETSSVSQRCITSFFEFYLLVELKRPKHDQHLAEHFDGYRKIVDTISGHSPEIASLQLNGKSYYSVRYHTGNNITALRVYYEDEGELKVLEGESIYSNVGHIELVDNEIEVIHQEDDWQQKVTYKDYKYYQLKAGIFVLAHDKRKVVKHSE